MSWNQLSAEKFEDAFPDIGGWNFAEVFTARPKFVSYSQIWFEATGVYEKFQRYCKGRIQHEKIQQVT
jgi:hypothetical protein